MFKKKFNTVIREINTVFATLDENQVEDFVNDLLKAQKIVTVGAGRVGLTCRAFSTRLNHLGFMAFTLGDSNVPHLGENDMLVVCSGSGETQTIYDLVKIAKQKKVKITLITGNVFSRMGKSATKIVNLKAPSKLKNSQSFKSIQPMTTLNEQCLNIFFDVVVLELMDKLSETDDVMWSRHSELE